MGRRRRQKCLISVGFGLWIFAACLGGGWRSRDGGTRARRAGNRRRDGQIVRFGARWIRDRRVDRARSTRIRGANFLRARVRRVVAGARWRQTDEMGQRGTHQRSLGRMNPLEQHDAAAPVAGREVLPCLVELHRADYVRCVRDRGLGRGVGSASCQSRLSRAVWEKRHRRCVSRRGGGGGCSRARAHRLAPPLPACARRTPG